MKIDAIYTSRWDGETEVNSHARIDLDTGKIVDIQSVDMGGLCVLDDESISLQLGDMTSVFEVVEDDDGDYAVDPDDLKQIRAAFTPKFVEHKWQKAKKEYQRQHLIYKNFKRRELLEKIFSTFQKKIETAQNEDLISMFDNIKTFNPLEVYPQRDIFLYDGYRIWCESFIFVNEDRDNYQTRTEKAIIIRKDADFDSDSINVIDRNQGKFFTAFANVEVEGLEDWLDFLQNINYDEDIVEVQETVK